MFVNMFSAFFILSGHNITNTPGSIKLPGVYCINLMPSCQICCSIYPATSLCSIPRACKSAPCCNSYSGEHFSFFGKNDRTDRNTPANGIIARLANSADKAFAEP